MSEESRGTPRMKVINRRQMLMRPVNVEELVEADHPVRALWHLVGRLDLSRFYREIEAVAGVAGRPALDPILMISLWFYGYSEGVSSAREISRLCSYHPAYQWLTAMEPVNYHSLSDFPVDHQEALRELFVQVSGVLSSEGLVTLQRVMHDGTNDSPRIRAEFSPTVAGPDPSTISSGTSEGAGGSVGRGDDGSRGKSAHRAQEAQAHLESAVEELEKIRARKEGAEAKKEARVSESDPEARIM